MRAGGGVGARGPERRCVPALRPPPGGAGRVLGQEHAGQGPEAQVAHGAMHGAPAWPLRLLARRCPAACLLGPPSPGLGLARPPGAGPGLAGGAGGGAGLARLLGLWTRPPGADRCAALARPRGPRLPRAGLPGGPAVAARVGGKAWRRGPEAPAAAASDDDSRLRPEAGRRSEARKLLGLARPERRRLAGTPTSSLRPPGPGRWGRGGVGTPWAPCGDGTGRLFAWGLLPRSAARSARRARRCRAFAGVCAPGASGLFSSLAPCAVDPRPIIGLWVSSNLALTAF